MFVGNRHQGFVLALPLMEIDYPSLQTVVAGGLCPKRRLQGPSGPLDEKRAQVARQIGDWIADQASADVISAKEPVKTSLETLNLELAGGRYVTFARRISVAKSSVHGWLFKGVLPRLGDYLRVALHAGIPFAKLMRGDLSDWSPPNSAMQLELVLERGNREDRRAPRIHDWGAIRHELERMLKLAEPISVAEAGVALGRITGIFNLRTYDLARALGERWKHYKQARKNANRERAKALVMAACRQPIETGLGCSLGEIRQMVPADMLDSVEGVFELIGDVREEIG
ncbi:MAG: hypothetical protein ACLPXB_10880 [Thiobacillaceae bacterium]